nr:amidohydrolase family protein [Cryptosporangium phraense]
MQFVGLEEHVSLPSAREAWARAGLPQTANLGFGDSLLARRMRDVADLRIADMDDQGVDVQVLSLTQPGVQVLAPADAIAVAREVNDQLAEIVAARPDRFQAFAVLPTPNPEAAAVELERAVNQLGLKGAMLYGRTGDRLADHPDFDVIYEAASRLRVPLHFHPQMPAAPVVESYYANIGPIGTALAGPAIGWYYDLGIQYLRMIFSGVFDRHPELQVIAGHWGEIVLFFLDHTGYFAEAGGLQRPLLDYFRQNFWVAGSGTVSERYLRWTAEVMTPARMLYSTDYPYTYDTRPGGFPFVDTSHGVARTFLEDAPFTTSEKEAIASSNWEKLSARAEGRSVRRGPDPGR